MAAGLGFKTFNTGDVLSAADTNGYLMQGIWVFANAAARDAAVTSPQEGNACYLKDTDVIQVYSGSAWVTKSGGSSPLTTKGDLYTYSTTDARIGVGANDTVLTADSSTATGLKWATPAAGVTAVGAAVYGGADQSCPNETLVIVNFNNEYYDTDSMHSTTTNTSRITIPTGKGGIYLISGELAYSPGTQNKLGVNIKKNGNGIAQFTQGAVGGDFDSQIPFAFTASLAAGDYIELEARQLSGTTINVKPNGSIFCVNKLGD